MGNKTFVVTGGCGFIGHHLVRALAYDSEVVILDNLKRGDIGRLSGLGPNVTFESVDITDRSQLFTALEKYKVDCLYHLAAINGTSNFYNYPVLVMDVGIKSCINVLEAAKLLDIPQAIIASSAEVYQTPSIIPTPEHIPLIIPDVENPRYSYALSKIVTEYYAYQFGVANNMNVAIFRPHNVYGSDMGLQHVIPQFIMQFLKEGGKTVDIVPRGNIESRRAFCHVSDIVSGLRIIENSNLGVNVYNLGSTEEITISNLIDEISASLDINYRLVVGQDYHQGGTARRVPDIKKAASLGYSPRIKLADGIHSTAQWYKSNYDRLKVVSEALY